MKNRIDFYDLRLSAKARNTAQPSALGGPEVAFQSFDSNIVNLNTEPSPVRIRKSKGLEGGVTSPLSQSVTLKGRSQKQSSDQLTQNFSKSEKKLWVGLSGDER